MKYYAGIGPRSSPSDVQHSMKSIARQLSPTGWCLRSGNATGADQAFQRGATQKNIFLPFQNFNFMFADNKTAAYVEPCEQQIEIAARHHPAWKNCSDVAKALLARNVLIILGEHLDDPVEMVVTWFPEGYSGGTMHALRIASTYGIPVFNIRELDDLTAMAKFIMNSENRANQNQQKKAA